MKSLKRQQAVKIIEEHFAALQNLKQSDDVLVSARDTGRRMVEIYRLLTNEMPQVPGLESEYHSDELPALEWASPTERDPNECYQVITDVTEPDILIPGDQNGDQESEDRKLKQTRAGFFLPPKSGEGE